jgi:hypothetical protein
VAEWLLEKRGTKTRWFWRKLHIGMDADTGQIVVAALTTHDVDDGAYDQEGVAAAVAEFIRMLQSSSPTLHGRAE